jgi:hypothetical protein
VDVSSLHVDAVWGENTLKQALAEAVGGVIALDYIVASHVIEHVPDLIGWLREIEECLNCQGGSLRLAIPDKRYTFDFLRVESSLVGVLDAHVRQRRVPSSACVLDFALNMVTVDCRAAWNGNIDVSKLAHGYTQAQAIALAKDAEDNNAYHDVHCWVFTPRSFVELMLDLSRRDLIGFSCAQLIPTAREEFEFFVHLSPDPDRISRTATWAEAARMEAKGDV